MHRPTPKNSITFPSAPWVIGLLLVALGFAIAFLLPGSVSSIFTQMASKDWPATSGIITHADVVEWDGLDESTYRSDIRARYQIDGRDYYLFGIYPGHSDIGSNSNVEAVRLLSRYPVGKKVSVYYNPLDPHEAVLERGIHSTPLFLLPFALVPALLGFLLLGYSVRQTWRWILQAID